MRFFPSFISNTSIVSINFRANLDAQNAGNCISGLQISKILRAPYSCVVCRPHTWPSAIAIPCNILSYRKVPFQKMPPPPGKILKKGPDGLRSHASSTNSCVKARLTCKCRGFASKLSLRVCKNRFASWDFGNQARQVCRSRKLHTVDFIQTQTRHASKTKSNCHTRNMAKYLMSGLAN